MNKYLEENLTKEQKDSIEHLKKTWSRTTQPEFVIRGEGAVVVQCFSFNSLKAIHLLIEKDGYTHS
ncbi:MAG: hypothetical protein CMM02_18210 [Rhodopirellula sp.]|nr:hypothetical protein [Rhodopirellula sp.]|tara:strand:- start:1717 stop:1914 length:198 start_codon:yes stop_codon:yes gene_type:complete